MSLGSSGLPPASSFATAAAHTLAWAFAENADFGIAPAIEASPTTWTLGCSLDSNVAGSIGHHPVRSATPALCRPKSVTSVIAPTSTEVTLPPLESDTHSRFG